MAGTRGYNVKLFIFTLVFFRLVLFDGEENSIINILEKSRYIIKFISYIVRLTHKKRKKKRMSNLYEVHNQQITKAKDCENTPLVQ